jgi:ribosomal protein S27AE
MTEAVTSICPDHKDRFDCPDCLIHYIKETQEYGIIIHDGGTSFTVIQFCPWCGKTLFTDKSLKRKRDNKTPQNKRVHRIADKSGSR